MPHNKHQLKSGMISKQWLRPYLGDLRNRTLQAAACMAGQLGRHCLDRAGTLARLDRLGCLRDAHGVFSLSSSMSKTRIDILNCGVVRLGGKDCLDLDYGARAALRGWGGRKSDIGHAAALWSHQWMGYYHWLIDVAPKITAIQASMGGNPGDLRWVFPRTGEAYESEILGMLGVSECQVIDSHGYHSVRVDSVRMVALPGWFHIQPAAALLRERLLPFGGHGVGDRIYLKRKGRRICLNENEVVRFLATKGFTMVEDEPRTVAEQIGIFRNARIIIAPHGAALSNLLWCLPGSTVIECFADGYCPEYYENLASFSGLHYSCVGKTAQTHWTGVSSNIHIDIHQLAECMERNGIS
jgi:Glycosyltransferase 61